MNIVVCISQVPDTTTKVAIAPDGKKMAAAGVKYILNPYDEFAIEEGLQLRAKHGGTVTAVSVGGDSAKEVLRTALAMGADKAVLVKDDERHDSFGVAQNLAEVARGSAADPETQIGVRDDPVRQDVDAGTAGVGGCNGLTGGAGLEAADHDVAGCRVQVRRSRELVLVQGVGESAGRRHLRHRGGAGRPRAAIASAAREAEAEREHGDRDPRSQRSRRSTYDHARTSAAHCAVVSCGPEWPGLGQMPQAQCLTPRES